MAIDYGDYSSYNPDSDYSAAYSAASRRLSQQLANQKGLLTQSLAAAGNSGSTAVASEATDRNAAEARAGLVGGFAKEQAEQGLESKRQTQRIQAEEAMQQAGFQNQRDLMNTVARRQLQAGLIAGGIGAAGSLLQRQGGGGGGGGYNLNLYNGVPLPGYSGGF